METYPVIHWSADSISGSRKPENDDAWLVFSAGAEKSTRLSQHGYHSIESTDLVLAVSDGMGGGQAGDLASRLILTQLSQIIPKTIKAAAEGFHPDYMEQLEEMVYKIHDSINKHGENDPTLKGMAATLTLTWVTPNNLYIAHVGDTRLYRLRNGETTQLTEDHTYAWRQLNRGELREYQWRTHPKQSVLYEVVGGGHQSLKPAIYSIPYQIGDRYLLCSDGVIDGLWQKHIHAKLNANLDSTSATAASLISSAVDNAGVDDTTLIVFDVK